MATLREIQLCELDILKTVADICDRNNIPYYLAYGTFLGAVRHQGFIPWDDDVDIYMRYDDLKRFKKVCKKELSKKYFYQDNDTDVAAHFLFPKVRANGTSMRGWGYKEGVHANCRDGIWIDIFPLIDAAETPEKIDEQLANLYAYQHDMFLRQPIEKGMGLVEMLKTIRCNIKGKILLHRYQRNFDRLQSEKSDFMFVMGNAFLAENTEENKKKIFAKSVIQKKALVPQKYAFEDTVLSGLADYDAYLTMFYGDDYMTPKQWSHMEDYSHVTIG